MSTTSMTCSFSHSQDGFVTPPETGSDSDLPHILSIETKEEHAPEAAQPAQVSNVPSSLPPTLPLSPHFLLSSSQPPRGHHAHSCICK